jgi:two-component system response regulator AdeR
MIAKERPDAILLDVALPDGEGFDLCGQLRSETATAHVPILFLTSRANTADRLAAFSLGADDFVDKPFHPLELRARLGALLRRAGWEPRPVELLRLGNLEIDLRRFSATIIDADGGTEISLTAHEFRLLRHFATHHDRVFSRRDLVAATWNGTIVSERTVDTHVSNLRRKLAGCGHYLQSVRGVGYRLLAVRASASEVDDGDSPMESGSGSENAEPRSGE